MATAVREEWNNRRPPERAARESNRGGEASSAARKARSRPLTYKGGAPLLFPNCSTRAEWHRHIPCGRGMACRSDTERRGTREKWNASAMGAIERS
jgi:hypothetical protein